jgi:hypothetical protein
MSFLVTKCQHAMHQEYPVTEISINGYKYGILCKINILNMYAYNKFLYIIAAASYCNCIYVKLNL